jgi:TIR domain
MHDVFISYVRDDQTAAHLIADRLSSKGFSVFLDRDAIVSGDSYSQRIANEIRSARAVVALLSSRSRKNKWVADELQTALDSKAVVVPVLLDKGAKDNWLWPLLATRHSVELDLGSADPKSELDKLVRELSAELGRTTQAPVLAVTHVKMVMWISIGIAVASAAVSAFVTFLATR